MIKYLYFSEVSFSAFPQDELGQSEVWVGLLDPDHHEDEGLGVLAGEEARLDVVVQSHLAVTAGADLAQLTLGVYRSSGNSNNVQGPAGRSNGNLNSNEDSIPVPSRYSHLIFTFQLNIIAATCRHRPAL